MGKPIAARATRQPPAHPTMPASHKVKLVLRRGIVAGTIPGGTRLVQTSIASEMGVGAQQVRDALRELAAEGFVKLDSRGGAVVHELGRSELQDIYEIRMMLEPLARLDYHPPMPGFTHTVLPIPGAQPAGDQRRNQPRPRSRLPEACLARCRQPMRESR